MSQITLTNYDLREFVIHIRPLDEDDIYGIPYWTERDTIVQLDEARQQLISDNVGKLKLRVSTDDKTGQAQREDADKSKCNKNKLKVDTTKPVNQRQYKQTPKSMRFDPTTKLKRTIILNEFKETNSGDNQPQLSEQQQRECGIDESQTRTTTAEETSIRKDVTIEELDALIPTTLDALDIDIDNIQFHYSSQDDCDSVSCVSSESGDYEFQTCPRRGVLSFDDDVQNASGTSEQDYNDEDDDSIQTHKRHIDSFKPGIELDYNIERGG